MCPRQMCVSHENFVVQKSIRLPGLEPGTNRSLYNRLQSTALPIAPQPAGNSKKLFYIIN